MLTAHHISKSYGIQPILQDVSFNINPGERLGLIGPNGAGKTTLLRILAGLERPDEGSVLPTRPGLRIGYLAQGASFEDSTTLAALLASSAPTARQLEAELSELASALAAHPHDAAIQSAYDATLQRLSQPAPAPAGVLSALGLAHISLDARVGQLSGGQKTRLMLGRVLLEEPDLLLLDEPTNHLDIEMLEWLEAWLSAYRGAALVVSHDRVFLDHTVTSILALDELTRTITAYTGNYTAYLEQYIRRRERQMAAYRDQVAEVRRVKQDIARTKEQARHVEITTTPRQPGVRRIAKKVAAKAKSRERRLARYLNADERVERPRSAWQIKLDFGAPDMISQNVLSAEQLQVGYAAGEALLHDINLHVRAGERIALTGPNGCGKTTLLRTLAGRLQPLSGQVRLGSSVRLGYMAQEQELLDPGLSALETIQQGASFTETEARNFLHYFLFEDDDPLRPTRDLSYGERARLQLAILVAQGSTCLLLDEPINHLDIPSRARFEQALSSFEGTVLAVVHDRYFIQRFASAVWTVKNGRIAT